MYLYMWLIYWINKSWLVFFFNVKSKLYFVYILKYKNIIYQLTIILKKQNKYLDVK